MLKKTRSTKSHEAARKETGYLKDITPQVQKELNKLRVLITGGAGFIGSHLADAYLHRGDEVFVIDDLSTGTFENIQHLKTNPRFHYTIDSVHNQPVTAELVDQCDVVFHLAAAVGV